MMRKIIALVLTCLIFQCNAADLFAPVEAPELRAELLKMLEVDQIPRLSNDKDVKSTMMAVDNINRARLKEIVALFGWPTFSMVGKDGAKAAFVIAQHSNPDPEFQKYVLELMKPLVERKEASAIGVAYLYDRIHRPQLYGTQGACAGDGLWVAREIEDAAHVDERRAAVGIVPATMAEYAAMVGKYSCQKN